MAYLGDPVQIAQEALIRGTDNLFDILPKAVNLIIQDKLWQRNDRQGEPFTSFEAFVLHSLPEGLEIASMDRLVDFVRDSSEVVKMVQGEMGALNENGGDRKTEGARSELQSNTEKRGNSNSYLLKRLKRDHPQIAEDYIQGNYPSVRQAAIAAGIVKVKTPLEELLTIAKKLDSEELITAKREFRRMGMSTTVTSKGVSINSGPLEATDRPSAIPKEKWRFLMRGKRSFLNVQIKYLCKCLLDFIQDAEEMWEELGYTSRDDMLVNGYELDLSEVELATQWLKIKDEY